MASMYFFGRVDAVLSEAELEERMAAAGRMIEGKPSARICKNAETTCRSAAR
ncbi:hypothetical protein H9L15_05860 [Sphingomonas daechungensis]|uniref:Uncharacterized protein n=1 Tax=Sphingomonas daechungensis TaxID=1176646 RepID=A0ABX6T2H9_9SPHN|nr:hypothetical protein [Sphingomonas daechungensis]QNP44077.1 hypothetical protein H9L15_05860 [Sphingomonas daechungensis]